MTEAAKASDAAPARAPREILAPEEVLAAGPPPVPELAAPLSARLAAPDGADLDLVHAWMNLPHVARFFDQAWSRKRWAGELAAQQAGTFSRPLLIGLHGTPVAYVELYRAARDVIAAHYDADPHDIGFHIAIGDPGGIGRGLGPRIFDACARGVFAADGRCRRILIEPDAANTAARRAAEHAGLALLDEIELPHKRAALMVRTRSEGDPCGLPALSST
ncbi:MAG: GNAT family N-acetyltransferase [Nocardiopsaceae bacterium]|nr:GNAT family N-acetyltransferase [Nocardiopsaceae bacterium]